MSDKYWILIGGLYIVFALTIATMATYQESNTFTADQPTIVAQATESPAWRGERLDIDDANPRRNLFLTIWSTRDCYGCQQQEAEIPALQAAGYNVVLRKVPAPRWAKSFPTTVVTRDTINGEEVTRFSGYKTTKEIDEILQIGEAEEEEVEDYNIFSPKAQVGPLNLVVWLSDTEECDRQYDEIIKLRKKGFTANVYMIEAKRPPRHITATPTIILIDNRKGVCIGIWRGFVTAEEILDALH